MLSTNVPGSWLNGVKFDHSTKSSLWAEIPGSSKNAYHVHDQKFYVGQPRGADVITRKLTYSRIDSDVPNSVATGDRLINDVDDQAQAAIPQRSIQVFYLHSAFVSFSFLIVFSLLRLC